MASLTEEERQRRIEENVEELIAEIEAEIEASRRRAEEGDEATGSPS